MLNLFDLLCTLCVMSVGVGEMNPLFRDPGTITAMIVYKVFVVGCLLWWLSQRTERIAHIGLRICTAAYAGVAVWHLAGIAVIYSH